MLSRVALQHHGQAQLETRAEGVLLTLQFVATGNACGCLVLLPSYAPVALRL
jgi:hypothetical protein